APGDAVTAPQTPGEPQAQAPEGTATQPPAQTPGQTEAEDAGLLPLLSGPDFENALQTRLDELEAERQAADLAVLSRELTLAGVPPAVAQTEAEQLMASGIVSLSGTVTDMEAAAARVVAAQRSGDVAGARAEIEDIRSTYHSGLAPVMRTANPGVGSDTE